MRARLQTIHILHNTHHAIRHSGRPSSRALLCSVKHLHEFSHQATIPIGYLEHQTLGHEQKKKNGHTATLLLSIKKKESWLLRSHRVLQKTSHLNEAKTSGDASFSLQVSVYQFRARTLSLSNQSFKQNRHGGFAG